MTAYKLPGILRWFEVVHMSQVSLPASGVSWDQEREMPLLKAAAERKSEKVLVAQLCPTLCDFMDCSPPGSSVHGILQARIPEWVAIPFSSLGDLPDPGIEPRSPALQADSLLSEPPGRTPGIPVQEGT